MAPRSASRGATKKSSARAKKSKPFSSDLSLVPSSPMSTEETRQDTDGTPNVRVQASELETYDSVTEDDVVEGGEDPSPSDTAAEKITVSMEEIESASVTAMEIMESKRREGTGEESDVKKPIPNESAAPELENAKTSKANSSAATLVEGCIVVVEEKSVEVKDSIKLNEAATPKEPVSPLSEELASEKMSQEPELLSVSPFEDTVSSGTGDKMNMDEGLKQNVGEGIVKDDKKTVPSFNDNVADCVKGVSVNHDSANDANDENEEIEESDQEFYMQAVLMEGKGRKESEIFIGGLDKGVVEDDLVKVFKAFGEIQSVRIVKHPTTKKSKGFAFVGFSSDDYAMKALTELKDGIEVNGKRVRVQASHDNTTLFLGNISKAWSRDHVIETLKSFGVERMEGLILPEDSIIEGKIKGFAFLEFSSNSDAMAAFQRLRKPDVFFGRDTTARVLFVCAPLHPSQEAFLQIKTVCIEGIPLSWDEEKIREICKEYGQIEKVLFSRNFSSSKRKDFGFVKFSSHESVVASVDGINNAQLDDGDTNIRASLSKPLNKGQHTRQDHRGASMIKKDGEANQEVGRKKKKKEVKSKGVEHEEEIQLKLKNVIETGPSGSENKGSNNGLGSQIAKSVKRKKGSGNAIEVDLRGSSKKMKVHHNHNDGKVYGQHSSRARKKKSSYRKNPKKDSGSHLAAYPARYQRPTNSEYYEPQFRQSDLEPHAGYLPAVKQVSTTYEYDQRRSGAYNSEQRRIPVFSRAMQRQPTSYLEYTRYADHQPFGYRDPRTGAYAPRGPYY